MAVLSTLVKAIADVEGLEEVQVGWVARYLREAGLISSGGRGRGGAAMTTADAANLLIGLNASHSPKDAVDAVVRFRTNYCVDPIIRGGERLKKIFVENKSFGSALEELIEDAMLKELDYSWLDFDLLLQANAVDIHSMVFGSKAKLTIDEAIISKKYHLSRIIVSEIVFKKTRGTIEVRIMETGSSGDGPPAPPPESDTEREKQTIVSALYWPVAGGNDRMFDRKDQTSISLATIVETARILSR